MDLYYLNLLIKNPMPDNCEKLVQDFADWCRRYPSDELSDNDEACLDQFLDLEKRAKLLKPEKEK